MEQSKNIGSINQVEQPKQVTESQQTHSDKNNYLQEYLPQNGGEIQAKKG